MLGIMKKKLFDVDKLMAGLRAVHLVAPGSEPALLPAFIVGW